MPIYCIVLFLFLMHIKYSSHSHAKKVSISVNCKTGAQLKKLTSAFMHKYIFVYTKNFSLDTRYKLYSTLLTFCLDRMHPVRVKSVSFIAWTVHCYGNGCDVYVIPGILFYQGASIWNVSPPNIVGGLLQLFTTIIFTCLLLNVK